MSSEVKIPITQGIANNLQGVIAEKLARIFVEKVADLIAEWLGDGWVVSPHAPPAAAVETVQYRTTIFTRKLPLHITERPEGVFFIPKDVDSSVEVVLEALNPDMDFDEKLSAANPICYCMRTK